MQGLAALYKKIFQDSALAEHRASTTKSKLHIWTGVDFSNYDKLGAVVEINVDHLTAA